MCKARRAPKSCGCNYHKSKNSRMEVNWIRKMSHIFKIIWHNKIYPFPSTSQLNATLCWSLSKIKVTSELLSNTIWRSPGGMSTFDIYIWTSCRLSLKFLIGWKKKVSLDLCLIAAACSGPAQWTVQRWTAIQHNRHLKEPESGGLPVCFNRRTGQTQIQYLLKAMMCNSFRMTSKFSSHGLHLNYSWAYFKLHSSQDDQVDLYFSHYMNP